MLSVLVVCTGNICRSPIAEGILAERSKRLLDGQIGIGSAGTWAQSGREPMPESVAAARKRGVDIRALRSTRLTEDLVAGADLVLTMTEEQRAEVAVLDSTSLPKTFTLKELVRLLAELPATEGPPNRDTILARITGAHERRVPASWRSVDDEIIDPLGLSIAAYHAVAWEIESAIDGLISLLFGVSDVETEAATAHAGEQ